MVKSEEIEVGFVYPFFHVKFQLYLAYNPLLPTIQTKNIESPGVGGYRGNFQRYRLNFQIVGYKYQVPGCKNGKNLESKTLKSNIIQDKKGSEIEIATEGGGGGVLSDFCFYNFFKIFLKPLSFHRNTFRAPIQSQQRFLQFFSKFFHTNTYITLILINTHLNQYIN